jgi:hypothetical protein
MRLVRTETAIPAPRVLPGRSWALAAALLAGALARAGAAEPFEISGIYPHLATFNDERECGTGAVVPWADRLWVITYAPHMPKGSSDKLYEITPDLRQIVRPESVGGTPANRMIHRESQQLFIGPYAIDAERNVRVIPYEKMFGRPTGTARHLFDPAGKVYYASMEEGFYEVDVKTLAVTELFRDEQVKGEFRRAGLPGYHGKGLFSGQGVLVYANNGENSTLARQKPDIPSGALASWDGRSDRWTVVRRNQFTEVTGPGGVYGNEKPETDPLWTIGWDHRSLILMTLDRGQWHSYRLPKASHSYDGAHGWNTEWPRIREIGETDLLMTMHGTFWRFPRDFRPGQSAGIAPRSNYLKVLGDFARWGDRIVLGCDDTAASEFLNKRRAKGELAGPGQSQSNLVFLRPEQLDRFGPPLGRGAVWFDEPVRADVVSDAYLFSGYERRGLHLAHHAGAAVSFTLEVDRAGDGRWTPLRSVEVPAAGYAWVAFPPEERGAWVRLRAARDVPRATAMFVYRNADRRGTEADARFAGLARGTAVRTTALLHARGQNKRTLAVATGDGYYEMGADMVLRRTDEKGAREWTERNVAIPREAVAHDAASVIYTDEAGKRWRLPRAPGRVDAAGGAERVVREVCTERDLLNAGGTFFELPAENAGGIAKVRPVATHLRAVHDFATWRGLLVVSGLESTLPAENRHLIRAADGRVALWVGSVDDLWAFGRPRGEGGPWSDTTVRAGEPSEPYLMTGYERKRIALSHRSDRAVGLTVQVDITGTGAWVDYLKVQVPAGRAHEHVFPAEFEAYWVRVVSDAATTATARLVYE